MEKKDYGSEIIALCALTVLSALSHFWFIMIAIAIGLCLAGLVTLASKIYLHARMVRESDLYSPPPVRLAKPSRKGILEAAHGSGASLPVGEA